MMRSKYLALLTVLLLTACSSNLVKHAPSSAKTDGPIIVVKIDDTNDAHPQIGIDKADLVYIEQVEGGLVRLAAIFANQIPAQIGPVRSARISDIDLLSQFGKVAFFYSGAQSKFLPELRQANLEDLGAEHESAKLYTRDSSRVAPYDLILQGEQALLTVKDKNIVKASSINLPFGKMTNTGTAILSVKVHWPAANYLAKWNGISWSLSHNGNADVTSDGVQLAPSTFVIQKVVITDSIYKDKIGGVTPFSSTIGEGNGWILRDGVAIAGTWNRPDASSTTSWKDAKGNPINFAKGQVWVALTDQEPEFTTALSKK